MISKACIAIVAFGILVVTHVPKTCVINWSNIYCRIVCNNIKLEESTCQPVGDLLNKIQCIRVLEFTVVVKEQTSPICKVYIAPTVCQVVF